MQVPMSVEWLLLRVEDLVVDRSMRSSGLCQSRPLCVVEWKVVVALVVVVVVVVQLVSHTFPSPSVEIANPESS